MYVKNLETVRSNIPDEKRNSADERSNSMDRRRNNADGRSESTRTTVTVTEIHENNETGKQTNFAGDLFIEISSAELF